MKLVVLKEEKGSISLKEGSFSFLGFSIRVQGDSDS